MKLHAALLVLAAAVAASATATAQPVTPGCLQPDRGVVRAVPGIQLCQPNEVAVLVRVRPSLPSPASVLAPPKPAEPDPGLAEFFGLERASSPLGVVVTRSAAGLAVPSSRTLAPLGAGTVAR